MKTTDYGIKKYAETKRLIKIAMQEGQLVLFVGAGASVDAGMPLWNAAVSQISEKLGLENDSDKIDNLVIPQYYYNLRGRKEYTQLIREIFHYNEKLYPGAIQDAIIRFRAKTIITTNYDHLIEQAAENKGEFLYVVSQDSDLPYRKSGKELIKMHGDFEHDNFVLKEDDYLHYHKNFKLIENYVKSLIGTKTVLFVGYSLSDPDVKHIFSWVKEILDEHFQKAYLIVTGRTASQNEIEYFKHIGVNLIYATELFDINKIGLSNHSKQLLQTLNYFIDDEEEKKGIIDSLYDYLKPFDSLNYTYGKYIKNAFYRLRNKVNDKISLHIGNDNYVEYWNQFAIEEEKKFFSELEIAIDGESNDPKVRTIAGALEKSCVKGTKREESLKGRIHFEIKEFSEKESNHAWIQAIMDFNYKKLSQIKDFNARILSDNKPELYLQQAYICYFLGDYLSAYYCLDNAANYFYRKREYAWYFISLWSKKNVAQVLLFSFGIPKETREEIKHDFEATDLEITLQTIPDLGNNNNQFLRDLINFKFASDLFYDVVSNSMKASTQSRVTYTLFAGMPAYAVMRQIVYDYYYYGIYNCLFVDRYRENDEIINLFARTIFASVAAPDKEIYDISEGSSPANIHADSLNATDIHLIIRFITARSLRKLFDEFNISIIEVDENGKEYLKRLIESIPTAFDFNLGNASESFWRLVSFISHTKIEKEVACSLLYSLTILPKAEYRQDNRDTLFGFIHAIYTQSLYQNKELCGIAKTLIRTLIAVVSDSKDYIHYYKMPIISLVSFCEKGDDLFDDVESVRKILSEEYYLLLAQIYKKCTESIKQIIKTMFNKWTCPNSESGYILYSEIVLAGIMEPNEYTEDEAIAFLTNNRECKKTQLESGIIIESADELEQYLINLFLSGLFIGKEKLKDYVLTGDNEFSKWLIDIEGYEYKKFNLIWLKKVVPSFHKRLSENKKVRECIISIYKEKYSSTYIDSKTNEIIIKNFV